MGCYVHQFVMMIHLSWILILACTRPNNVATGDNLVMMCIIEREVQTIDLSQEAVARVVCVCVCVVDR